MAHRRNTASGVRSHVHYLNSSGLTSHAEERLVRSRRQVAAVGAADRALGGLAGHRVPRPHRDRLRPRAGSGGRRASAGKRSSGVCRRRAVPGGPGGGLRRRVRPGLPRVQPAELRLGGVALGDDAVVQSQQPADGSSRAGGIRRAPLTAPHTGNPFAGQGSRQTTVTVIWQVSEPPEQAAGNLGMGSKLKMTYGMSVVDLQRRI
jgi:hypothetical protein